MGMTASRLLVLLAAVLLTVDVCSQEITVEKVAIQIGDNTATADPRTDINGDTCALIIIDAGGLQSLQFPDHNQYTEARYSNGKYYVYMPAMLTKLTYGHDSYQRGDINLRDWGFRRLKGGKTYSVTLSVPQNNAKPLMSAVVVKVRPEKATLYVDDQQLPPSIDGNYQLDIAEGTHHYKAMLQDYNDAAGSFTIASADTKTMSVMLKPKTMTVTVKCNVSDASVYIDDVYYGKPGQLVLPQGRHTLRLHADKYIDYEKTMLIYPNCVGELVVCQLEKNKNQVDIHAVDVTIISSASYVYKNNKKIQGWKSGIPIKMMPGKYLISDSQDSWKKIVVEPNKPMQVFLSH